jgi:hypothetical protein
LNNIEEFPELSRNSLISAQANIEDLSEVKEKEERLKTDMEAEDAQRWSNQGTLSSPVPR